MSKLITCLQLMRPANVITSFADILVGFAIAGVAAIQLDPSQALPMFGLLGLLLLSTAGLYSGGVVMNDVCDAELDKIERPERAIPSGRISRANATKLGISLMVIGIIAAFIVSWVSGLLATIIAISALIYDAYTKPLLLVGPVNMAFCRACNLLLGVSIVAGMISTYWMLFFVHLFYISAVTLISKGEVNGGNKNMLITAFVLYIAALSVVISLVFTPHFNVWEALPFLVVLAYFIFTPLLKAFQTLESGLVRKAVKFGILGLIILDAGMAAGYAGWWYGLLMLLLLPLCMVLGKKFAVT